MVMNQTDKAYVNWEMNNVITELRSLTDWDDETIYDEITSTTKMSEEEEEMLAEKLGIL
jgi:hypothetical protein